MNKVVKLTIIVLLLAATGIAGYYYWVHEQRYPSTDDAYVQADVINIAPQVSGEVIKTYVQNQQVVNSGQALFDIDPQSYTIAVNRAQAERDNIIQQVNAANSAVVAAQAMVLERQAELLEAQHNTARIMQLVKQHLMPPSDGDQAIRNLNVAKAGVEAAQSELEEAKQKLGKTGDANANIRAAVAALAAAKLDLAHTHVTAPASGFLVNFAVRSGSEVTAYQPLFALVENNEWWATANFKETDLARLHSGQTAMIKLDMYPQHLFRGQVASISAGSGSSFALLPPENATGNWVKVTQRFPVKILINNPSADFPLRMGASATVVVDTASTAR